MVTKLIYQHTATSSVHNSKQRYGVKGQQVKSDQCKVGSDARRKFLLLSLDQQVLHSLSVANNNESQELKSIAHSGKLQHPYDFS
jgi:hypothetical protein